MRINNNITAINSHRQYGINNRALGRNVETLSSGFGVNRAGDDAAGLAISEKMRSQIRGLNQASRNSQDAISLVQTAEGGMQTIQDILQRMRERAVQSASDTNNQGLDRDALQAEFEQLRKEIDQIADTTEFNERRLLDGTWAGTEPVDDPDPDTPSVLVIQAGANAGQVLTINIGQMSAAGLDIVDLDISFRGDFDTDALEGDGAAEAIHRLSEAINTVSMQRANIGAMQNRLEFKIQNLDNQAENIAAAESRIRDVDMARAMTEFTRNNILFQASTAMLAQANALPQGVLQLIG
jgi:flagellin